ncbi:predicted protein [Pyrenophora tritici-repentis Pt-1C-BFP]|uniref:Uncharacterized protein n=1 Tax=Pyrenophora tritici-repentis (strain Pt-1C-BFP) TaxID=426418 RepID=B2W1W5_PYRTR|nr:uncharacterized protein PTRG_03413 [Pyrenophora tritici-repentis Pt-1C-BFP]EDU46251.1 predicted protein [Pyrenophora tritici-repentis Pt-1C-BFP]
MSVSPAGSRETYLRLLHPEYSELSAIDAYLRALENYLNLAKAHSVLTQHLQNPSRKYLAAANHVWGYLIGTQYYAICATAFRTKRAEMQWGQHTFKNAKFKLNFTP